MRLLLIFSIAMGCFSTACVTRSGDRPAPKPYPFNYCAVNKQEFHEEEGPKYGRIHDGYRVKFCCLPCTKAFDINPEAFMGPIREFYSDKDRE